MAYSFIQTKAGIVDAGSQTSVSTGNTSSGITAGSTLVAFVTFVDPGTATVTLSDSVGSNDTWVQTGSTLSRTTQQLRMYRLLSAASGTLNLNVAFSTAVNWPGVAVYEFSGAPTYDTWQGQVQAAPGTGTDAISSTATGTLGGQPALVVGFTVTFDSTGTPTSGTGYTADPGGAIWAFGGVNSAIMEHKRVTATSAVTSTFTTGGTAGSDGYATMVATFLEGGGATTYPINVLKSTQGVAFGSARMRHV